MDTQRRKSKVIHVYRNGDEYTRAVHVVLKTTELREIDMVLQAIEEKVVLPSNRAIRRLYSIDGKRIASVEEIEEGKFYVAAAADPFIVKKYGQVPPNVIVTRVARGKYDNVCYLFQMPTAKTPKPNATDGPKEKTPPKSMVMSYTEGSHKNSTTRAKPAAPTTSLNRPAKRVRSEERLLRKDSPDARKSVPPVPKAPKAAKPKEMEKKSVLPPVPTSKDKEVKQKHPAAPSKPKKTENSTSDSGSGKAVPKKKPSTPKQEEAPIPPTETANSTEPPNQTATPASGVDEEELAKAAETIQASFRGFKTRSDLTNKSKETNSSPEHQGESEEEPPKPAETNEETSESAATTEHPSSTSASPSEEELQEAATKIQSGFRGYKARVDVAEMKKAATSEVNHDPATSSPDSGDQPTE